MSKGIFPINLFRGSDMRQTKHDKGSSKVVEGQSSPSSVDIQQQVAMRAYYKSESRGFTSGRELDDWLEAEAEVVTSTKSH